jgi:hypothetical protein
MAKEIMNLADKASLSYFEGFFNMPKKLQHGADGFNSPPKESELQIFNAFKIPSTSVGFETVNLGSNGKHANH